MQSMIKTRCAAIGAAVAVTVGAGDIGLVSATSPSDAVTSTTSSDSWRAAVRREPAVTRSSRRSSRSARACGVR